MEVLVIEGFAEAVKLFGQWRASRSWFTELVLTSQPRFKRITMMA